MNEIYSLRIGNCIIYTGPLQDFTGRLGIIETIEEVKTNIVETLFSISIKSDPEGELQSIAAYSNGIKTHLHPFLLTDHVLQTLGFIYDEQGFYVLNSTTIVNIPGYIEYEQYGIKKYVRAKLKISEGDISQNEPKDGEAYVSYLHHIQNYFTNVRGTDSLTNSIKNLIGFEPQKLIN
ncbi:hypothetical protein GO730_37905 [Spirosoma sp. HMF3257]|uniref:Uncharacterized protein n=1 Tax=Spirosoma telluris TaxID=2183553 RepID=A0A327NKT8_9BACT|nr:hypothetical protein [Spirosoma telluris]RAI73148.1 hypothetical protein HMF3257_37810 [Spirosoma telluris]